MYDHAVDNLAGVDGALWGVCWMFYSSPGRTTGVTEPQDQSFLDYQLQPEGIGGELLFSGLNDVDLVSHSFWDPSFSDEWWTPQQPSTIYDPLIMTLDHDMEACPPDIKRPARPDIDGQSSSKSHESSSSTFNITARSLAQRSATVSKPREWGSYRGYYRQHCSDYIQAHYYQPAQMPRLRQNPFKT
ncbi:hypothetical protein LRP88_14321 [Fusarium phalaenopsidis]